jgi:hypothetical protein
MCVPTQRQPRAIASMCEKVSYQALPRAMAGAVSVAIMRSRKSSLSWPQWITPRQT